MTTQSLSIFLTILTWRKHSSFGISASPPAPQSDLLHHSTFGLHFKLSKNFVEMTLMLAPVLKSSVTSWSFICTL